MVSTHVLLPPPHLDRPLRREPGGGAFAIQVQRVVVYRERIAPPDDLGGRQRYLIVPRVHVCHDALVHPAVFLAEA